MPGATRAPVPAAPRVPLPRIGRAVRQRPRVSAAGLRDALPMVLFKPAVRSLGRRHKECGSSSKARIRAQTSGPHWPLAGRPGIKGDDLKSDAVCANCCGSGRRRLCAVCPGLAFGSAHARMSWDSRLPGVHHRVYSCPDCLRLNLSRSKRFMGRAIAAAPCAGLSYGALP